VIIRRSDDYFLCIYLNCMIYCLIRNRALQVGIRAMSVLSGPKPDELPVVFEWYVELTFDACCVVLLVVFPVVCDMYGSTVGTCFGLPFF